jgi:hypothetical protein
MWSSLPTQTSSSARLTARETLSASGIVPPFCRTAWLRSLTTAFGSIVAETCSASTPSICCVPSDLTSRTQVSGWIERGSCCCLPPLAAESASGCQTDAGTRQPVSPRVK